MKAENLPIKVVCFRLRDNYKLEPIGFVLIPLRIIPTFLYKNDLLATPRWYKMMGVSNNIAHNRPELHLNVIIQPEAECLSSTHLRGRIDDDATADDDPLDSFAEPDLSNHFELKLDEEELAKEEVYEAPVVVIKDEYDLNSEHGTTAEKSDKAESIEREKEKVEDDILKQKQMDLIAELLRFREEQKLNAENKLKEEENALRETMRINTQQEVKDLQDENASLKDRVRELEKAAAELLNNGVQQNQKIVS